MFSVNSIYIRTDPHPKELGWNGGEGSMNQGSTVTLIIGEETRSLHLNKRDFVRDYHTSHLFL